MWNQKASISEKVNDTVDNYFISFFDSGAPTKTVTGAQDTLIDIGHADLADHFISGIENPCIFRKPHLMSHRGGGRFLNGEARSIPLAVPYVSGRIELSPGVPDDAEAVLEASRHPSGIWIVSAGAYPLGVDVGWPYDASRQSVRYENSAIFSRSFVLKKYDQAKGLERTAGAITVIATYTATWRGLLP